MLTRLEYRYAVLYRLPVVQLRVDFSLYKTQLLGLFLVYVALVI
jgi:hypothetical protein